MRRRNCRVEIYFSKEELESLTKKYKKAGMNRETYCRNVLAGKEIREAPPAEYYELIKEVRKVGTNLNQLSAKANSLGFIDSVALKDALVNNHKTEAVFGKTQIFISLELKVH